jgi:hypothetical protein
MTLRNIQILLNIFLLVLALFFGYKWLYQNDGASEERIKQLEKELKEILKKKELNTKEIDFWKKRFDSLSVEDLKLRDQIIALEKETQAAERDALISKKKLEEIRANLILIRKKIENFKKNPPNREDEELLNSLKNKLK